MRFNFTDNEIADMKREFRLSMNPKEQVIILADMYLTTTQAVKAVLGVPHKGRRITLEDAENEYNDQMRRRREYARGKCKTPSAEKKKEYQKTYYENHAEQLRSKSKNYYQSHKEDMQRVARQRYHDKKAERFEKKVTETHDQAFVSEQIARGKENVRRMYGMEV